MNKKARIDFEDMNLQVGVRLQLMPKQAKAPAVQYTSLIGFVADEYLLLQVPQQDGTPVDLAPGTELALRVFSGVSVFTFEARIEAVVTSPRTFLVMSFPENIQKVGLRKAVRVKANIPVRIMNPVTREVLKEAMLSDISLSGALVSTSNPLGSTGDTIHIEFSVMVQSQSAEVSFATSASIRSVQQAVGTAPDGGAFYTLYTYGINFLDIDAAQQAILQNYVYETLLIHRS
ncbi:flagellar brake protein [Pseudorhodoferax sp.]|uniref:flagellar brake protein n=1 Tax=Pseudorhodoferax sp. TaxID=1993553 RepID=UPI0039E587FE